MTLPEFYDELERHDWHFAMSDDGRIYHKGLENTVRLERLALDIEGGPELRRAFTEYVFSGKPWGTEKKQKPERPKEIA